MRERRENSTTFQRNIGAAIKRASWDHEATVVSVHGRPAFALIPYREYEILVNLTFRLMSQVSRGVIDIEEAERQMRGGI